MSGAADGAGDDAAASDVIVLDVGSSLTKVGFSGEDSPRVRFSSIVGVDADGLEPDMASVGTNGGGDGADDDAKYFYVGDEVLSRRDALNISKPVQKTVVHDWDALEKMWEWCFNDELSVDAEAFPVLVMDSVLESKKSRETMAKIMFEKFNVKSFYIATQEVLSLFSSGLTSGVVLESGDEITRAVPVFEGYPLRHAASSTRLATRNLYSHFGKGLQVCSTPLVVARHAAVLVLSSRARV